MDETLNQYPGNTIVISGLGWETSPAVWDYLLAPTNPIPTENLAHDARPLEFLQQKKSLKFMSKQDRLAVSAAGKALLQAKPDRTNLTYNCDLFISVGYIPFEQENAQELTQYAVENGEFSIPAFTSAAYERINPLLAFACLPNMPAHHLAMNFELLGSYFITYPGAAQLYVALQEALARLQEGRISLALVGGTADQTNFLVQHHFRKCYPDSIVSLADTAAFMVLETEENAQKRNIKPLARLVSFSMVPHHESIPFNNIVHAFLSGPAGLPLAIATAINRQEPGFSHEAYDNNIYYHSMWEVL